jgi:tetratricopeptide (TPR) repeat protein
LFRPAWLAYGHSFAKQKEHDQAITAYFKAVQKNSKWLRSFSTKLCYKLPFVLHKMGVIKYESDAFEDAEEIFKTTW